MAVTVEFLKEKIQADENGAWIAKGFLALDKATPLGEHPRDSMSKASRDDLRQIAHYSNQSKTGLTWERLLAASAGRPEDPASPEFTAWETAEKLKIRTLILKYVAVLAEVANAPKTVSTPTTNPVAPVSGVAGKTICFTGTLSCMTREKATELVESWGGTVSKSVTNSTTTLVVGPDGLGSTKHKKAHAMGIEIWTEGTFLTKVPAYKNPSKVTTTLTERETLLDKEKVKAKEAAAAKAAGVDLKSMNLGVYGS